MQEKLEKLYLEQIEDYCNVVFDRDNLPAGVKLALKHLVETDPSDYLKTSEKLSDMSITYSTSGNLPPYIIRWIAPYCRPYLVGDKRKKQYVSGR